MQLNKLPLVGGLGDLGKAEGTEGTNLEAPHLNRKVLERWQQNWTFVQLQPSVHGNVGTSWWGRLCMGVFEAGWLSPLMSTFL